MFNFFRFTYIISLLVTILEISADDTRLKFGEGFPQRNVAVHEGYLDPHTFITQYVNQRESVLMKGAIKDMTPYKQWTDEYLLLRSLEKPEDVRVEKRKKEIRPQPIREISFSDFIRHYKHEQWYMAYSTPDVLRKDFTVPCCIQCSNLNLSLQFMWYSSGGTVSVVHSDAENNIHCMVRGSKTFTMVDKEYTYYVDLDNPGTSYGNVDANNVDYTKYPDLKRIPYYYNVSVEAGDCLFIPYRWIHQVRSFGSNIGMNFMWDYHQHERIDTSKCNKTCDRNMTLKDINTVGSMSTFKTPRGLYYMVRELIGIHESVTQEFITDVVRNSQEELGIVTTQENLDALVTMILKEVDGNGDGTIHVKELEASYDDPIWQTIVDIIKYMNAGEPRKTKGSKKSDARYETIDKDTKAEL